MEKININNSQLGYYLAGLIEGNGSLWTPEEIRSSNGFIKNPSIVFSFNKKEKPFYIHLKKILNTGKFSEENSSNTYKLYINEKKKIIDIINLINGKFRTPKINYLHNAIDYLNVMFNTNIKRLPLDSSDLESNAWLAGMSDSQGAFVVYLKDSNKILNLTNDSALVCSYLITQRFTDPSVAYSYVPFMTEIADLFGSKLYSKNENTLVFRTSATEKLHLIRSYFEKYPLMTTKYLDYLCYLQAQNYLNKVLTNEDLAKIKDINNSMNNNRIYFNWDHLNNFYV